MMSLKMIMWVKESFPAPIPTKEKSMIFFTENLENTS